MGRPFEQELSAISETYTEAAKCKSQRLYDFILNSRNTNVISVGSGGSYAVANTFALMMQELGSFAKSITPYELYMERKSLHLANVIIFTAGGSNPDTINAYEYIKDYEPKNIFIVCMKSNSKVIEVMKQNSGTDFMEFDVPNGKDGFLAVNSTIACLTILENIFQNLKMMCNSNNIKFNIDLHYPQFDYKNFTLITLGGNWTMPVAIDFESKCTEAALCNVQLSNYRNFAHGRHHWVSKHLSNTAIVCFVSKQEENIAKKTLALIPNEIPRIIISTEFDEISATIDLMVKMFEFVNIIGKSVGIDPGRPHVPEYGKKIYHIKFSLESIDANLKTFKKSKKCLAVNRKLDSLNCYQDYEYIRNIYEESYFCLKNKFKYASFYAVIFDYDNTIITDNDTTSDIFIQLMEKVNWLVANGIYVGFATGRGKSIKEQLIEFIPTGNYEKIVIGYYNGAFIGTLSEDIKNLSCGYVNKDIERIRDIIENDHRLKNIEMAVKASQITLFVPEHELNMCALIIREHLQLFDSTLNIVISGHSIDIILKSTSKQNVVQCLKKMTGGDVLCIGDSGGIDGNDFDLLNTDYSLSVDKCSANVLNCWKLSPLSVDKSQATLYYLNCLKALNGVVTLDDMLFGGK